jgi:hypothetical protein
MRANPAGMRASTPIASGFLADNVDRVTGVLYAMNALAPLSSGRCRH